jgi:hypothetical protein
MTKGQARIEERSRRSRGGHFSMSHPLAPVAGRNCADHLGPLRRGALGQIACGACWEKAIRDDERVVVEFGLPHELIIDPTYVDEIAVELAMRGERVELTPVERAEAVRRLDAARVAAATIGWRLGMSHDTVRSTLAGLEAAVPFTPGSKRAESAADASEVA